MKFGSKDGFTLASIRAGAATQMYIDGIDLSRIQWMGRWRSAKTLEIYIQEVAALNILAGCTDQQRCKIKNYSDSFNAICQEIAEGLRSQRKVSTRL